MKKDDCVKKYVAKLKSAAIWVVGGELFFVGIDSWNCYRSRLGFSVVLPKLLVQSTV